MSSMLEESVKPLAVVGHPENPLPGFESRTAK